VKDVKDILDTDGNSILSYTAFTAKYKIKTNFLEFYKVVSAVKLFRQRCSQQRNKGPKTKTFGQTLLASEKAYKTVYKSIIEKKATTPLKSQGKWLSEENIIGKSNRELGEYIPPPPSVYKRNKVTSVPIHVPPQTNSNKRLPL